MDATRPIAPTAPPSRSLSTAATPHSPSTASSTSSAMPVDADRRRAGGASFFGSVTVSPVMLRSVSAAVEHARRRAPRRTRGSPCRAREAWAGITMPTSGICRDPSGRGSWCTTTTSSTSITAVRTARPVRRARSSAHGVDPRPQLEGVEVDVAHGEHGRAEAVLAGVVLLHDDPVDQQGLRRSRAPSTAAGPSRCAISPRLSRWSPWSTARIRSARSTDWIIRPPSVSAIGSDICGLGLVPCRNTSVTSNHHSTLSNDIRSETRRRVGLAGRP